jgi:hypothetical protein
MRNPQTLVPIPPKLVAQIDKIAGHGHRTEFIVEVLEREIRRREQLAAIEEATGSWKDEDHPELGNGSDAWVRQMRQESEARTERLLKQQESK